MDIEIHLTAIHIEIYTISIDIVLNMEMLEFSTKKTNEIRGNDLELIRTSSIQFPEKTVLENIFPTQLEDTRVSQLRKTLGEKASSKSEEELLAMATDMQFLVDCWLDDFEKDTFDGRTLENLLKGTNNGNQK